jgi:adenylate cyclase
VVELRSEQELLVVFVDLQRFSAQSQKVTDAELANTMDAHYRRMASAVEAVGGRLVKFVGDGALAVFEPRLVDAAVAMLLQLKEDVDRFFTELGWECRATVKVHFGSVVAGLFGAGATERFDVLGKQVNTAATLTGPGVTLSTEAFRQLGPDARRRFKTAAPLASLGG